jgi:hypothetical protein
LFPFCRFGFDHLDGYFQYHSQHNPHFQQTLISEFPFRNIQFLVGLNDSVNCKLYPFPKPQQPQQQSQLRRGLSAVDDTRLLLEDPSSNSNNNNNNGMYCTDNDLATYCQAMLQGDNRLDRFLKWKHYITDYYHTYLDAMNRTFFEENDNDHQHHFMEDIPPTSDLPLTTEQHFHYLQMNHVILYVKDISHDPDAMMLSEDGKCLLFDYCVF